MAYISRMHVTVELFKGESNVVCIFHSFNKPLSLENQLIALPSWVGFEISAVMSFHRHGHNSSVIGQMKTMM